MSSGQSKRKARRHVSFVGWVSLYGGNRGVFNDDKGNPRFTAVYCTKKQATLGGISDAVRVRVTEVRRRG